MMKSSSSSTYMMTPLLFRNLMISILVLAEKSFSNLAQKHKAFELARCLFVSVFLFSLRLLLSLSPSPRSTTRNNTSFSNDYNNNIHDYYPKKKTKTGDDGSAIARALSQLLSLVNDIPVSSRKYQVVRSLAESLVHENHRQGEGAEALRHVNSKVLSAAFARTISQLEASAAHEQRFCGVGGDGDCIGGVESAHWLSRVLRTVRSGLDVVLMSKGGVGVRKSSAEKLAAEVLWLTEMMAACGLARDSVRRWASASNLARLSLSAEPRLQASLLKISALLLKYAKDMGVDEVVLDDDDDDDCTKERRRRRQTNMEMQMEMLVLWIPLLCRANNGVDVPILSMGERADLERVLEETIEKFDELDQERVLMLWLHHFTHCSSSDWPNLHASFARWCNASRECLLVHHS